jgi:hypothetical protein
VTEQSERTRLHGLAVRTFRAAVRWTTTQAAAYRPVTLPLTDRHALYTLNLFLAAVTFGDVAASALFPEADDPVNEWRRCLQRWQAAVDGYGWYSIAVTVAATRTWHGDRRDVVLRFVAEGMPAAEPIDAFWIHAMPPNSRDRNISGFRYEDHDLIQQTYQLRGEPLDELLRHALEPLLDAMGPAVTHFGVLDEQRSQSVAHSLVRVWITTALGEASDEHLTETFDTAVTAAVGAYPAASDQGMARSYAVLLQMLAREADRLPPEKLVRWCENLVDRLFATAPSVITAWAMLDQAVRTLQPSAVSDPRVRQRVAAAIVERAGRWKEMI